MPKPRRGKPAKAPVSSHPLFATLAALWFAALFGLACLVLPARLFETVVGLIGLPFPGFQRRVGKECLQRH